METINKHQEQLKKELEASIEKTSEQIERANISIAETKKRRKTLLKNLGALKRRKLEMAMDQETAENIVAELISKILGHTKCTYGNNYNDVDHLDEGEAEYTKCLLVTPMLREKFEDEFRNLGVDGLCASDGKRLLPSTDKERAAVERLGIIWPSVVTVSLE